ncbi:putative metal-dependent hydrolase [Novosphingobium capsulatum]|uniref:Metal-dependent hydrolase n=1 Tax=Novosphingobium capsulatum TaxID=13688 RepID=A0ABU1MSP1_9SPHN|nr:SprT family zinc-dependent metalloprotease [Novosphingobium capsulatum]MDR6513353.1 putative metal-dependent hydrolase [Novosphingobium capsulatum]
MTEEELFSVEYGATRIECRVVRRARKTLEIAVEPDMSVVIAAPMDATAEAIEAKVRKRATWIIRQQRFFAQFMPRMPERQFVAGETHRYLGRQYRLKVVPHVQQGVKMNRGFIVVQTHRPFSPAATRELVEAWYKDRAHTKFAERIDVNLQRFSDSEFRRPKGVIIRQMKQRWGSMSPGCRLMLNRRLIEAPVDAIDYVITHELCHVTEAHHGQAFYDLLARVLPDWERRKQRLEQAMA